MDTLKPIWYTDAELLINDLITDSIPQLNNKYTNKIISHLNILVNLFQIN